MPIPSIVSSSRPIGAASRALVRVASVILLAACAGETGTPSAPTNPVTPPAPGTLAVSVAPAALSLAPGQNGTVTATVTRGGSFTGAVDLVVDGAPSGLTATVSTTPIAAGSTTATVTVQAAATLAPGNIPLVVRARGTGVAEATASVAVTITAPPPPAGGIALARSGNVTIQQGQTGTATVTLTRSGAFAGAVDLTAEGIPAGVTVAIAPTTLAANATSATVTITAGTGAGVGTDGVTIRARGSGVSDATVLIPVTVTAPPPGAISLAVTPASVTVAPGQSVPVTITVNRLNGYTGTVALTSAVPSGLTATFNPSAVTGTTSTLTIAAGSTMPAGSYSVGVGATGAGVAGVSATVSVTVSAPPPPTGGGIAWTYCGTDRPLFFAVQDGTGPWTRVAPGNDGVFRFDVTQARGGVATVQANGTANTLNVYYLTAAEIQQFGTQFCDEPSSRTLTGTISGAAATDLTYVGFGNRSTTVVPSQTTAWSLANVQGGARDLIASRSTFALNGLNVNYTLAGLIVRRGVQASTGTSSQPVLDFAGAEAFAPAAANVTLANAGGELLTLITQFTTATGSSAPIGLEVTPSATTTRTWRGVPGTRTRAGDFHTLVASATASAQNSLVGRQITFYSAAVADRTLTFGPALATVSTASVGGGGMVRLRSQYTIQSAYDRFYVAQYQQQSNGRINQVQVSRGYLQNASGYDITVPDLAAVSGWQAAFGLATGVNVTWTFAAQGWSGGTTITNFGDGNSVLSATSGGQIVP